MDWIDDTGRHQGHVRCAFADGRLDDPGQAVGRAPAGDPDQLPVTAGGGRRQLRPPAAVIGWRVACTHVPAYLGGEPGQDRPDRTEQWLSPIIWHRVYYAAEEDLAHHRIHAPLDDPHSVRIADRDDTLEELLRGEWRAHLTPKDHAQSIRDAADAIDHARRTLDLDVAAARGAGMSWAQIGRAARVTRQAARERWGT